MRIACYFIGWNIRPTVRMTVKHYYKFCNKVTFLDNHSNDSGYMEAIVAGAHREKFGIPGVLDDGEYVKIKNTCWKGSDYDYVIVCDDDEILHHPQLAFILEQEKALGTTIFKTQGYNMMSREMPVGSWLEIKTGAKNDNYSKTIIFDPKAIKEIDFVYGCHVSRPKGRVQWSHSTLPVLHYRDVGGPERIIARQESYKNRLSPLNRQWGLGFHYNLPDEQKQQEWEANFANSHILDVFSNDKDDKAR